MVISLTLFAALIVAILAVGSDRTPDRPYDLNSSEDNGLLALRLWLHDMDYRVEATGAERFALPVAANLLFVYPNQNPYTPGEARGMAGWVEAGGTLVLIGPSVRDDALVDVFGVRQRGDFNASAGEALRQRQPLLPEAAPLRIFPGLSASLDLEDAVGAVAVYTNADDDVTVAVQSLGAGVVWHLSAEHTLTNVELRENTDQGALVPAFLRTVPPGGYVVFDTYHLYEPESAASAPGEVRIRSVQDWLYGTPVGWALLFSALTLGVYLVLQGRRLGPPLAVAAESRRREAAEYVEAVAALLRRGHKRQAVADYHRRRLKIGLGRPLHISPDLDDEEFLRRLQEADGRLEPGRLDEVRAALAGLNHPADEGQLVRLVAKTDEVLKD
jgi:hypothetical protein